MSDKLDLLEQAGILLFEDAGGCFMKNILIISSSPRKNGNSQLLCEEFKKGAEEKGNSVEIIRLSEKRIDYCKACDYCMKNNNVCVLKDDMTDLLEKFVNADVLVLATPVYFYGISAQMKTFIDRTYPIWQHLGKKEVYYIVSAGLDEKIIKRSLGDLDGFVEHFDKYEIKGRIYATGVMDAGKVCGTPVMDMAYQMGCHV
jgi:multimeric flavodoxin WrbA